MTKLLSTKKSKYLQSPYLKIIVIIAYIVLVYFGLTVLSMATLAVFIAALLLPIFVMINPFNNVLEPNMIFSLVFNGASSDEIWASSRTDGFPGVHFYLQNILKVDSWAMLTVNIGCTVGLFAVIIQFFKEKNILNACLGTVTTVLVICALTGVF